MKDIRIFVACNAKSYVPDNPLLFPIQTGAKDAAERFENALHDDSGDNISNLNPSFCELTAQYWAWKNITADYYGFFHNRRYLSFNEKRFKVVVNGAFVLGNLDNDSLTTLNLDERKMREVIENYDVITMEPVDLRDWSERSVASQYAVGMQHEKCDLDLAVEILKEKYPSYEQDAKQYLNGPEAYYLNIYIMRKELFREYCNWLFDILFELDNRFDKRNYSTYEMRKTGFVGERLFGVYLTHLRKTDNEVKIKHLQCCMFSNVETPYPKPAFDANSIPVVICSSDEYVPFTSVLLQSLVENSCARNNYDVLIMDNGISAVNKQLLATITADHSNVSIRFINIQKVFQDKKLQTIHNISTSSYGRLAVLEYFCHYPRVVYLDADAVLNADIAEIIPDDLSRYWLAAVRDPVSAGWCKMPRNGMRNHIRSVIGLDDPFDYFNAGVMVMNLEELRKATSTAQLFDLAENQEKWTWMDQDILNYVCKGHVKFLGQEWNLMVNANTHYDKIAPIGFAPKWLQDDYAHARKSPKLIHFAGGTHPCYRTREDYPDVFWGYARKTPFYEELLDIRNREKNRSEKAFRSRMKKKAMLFANLLAPNGSLRKSWVKSIYRRLHG